MPDSLFDRPILNSPDKESTQYWEIDQDGWFGFYSDTSHPFDKPSIWQITVVVINHLGNEMMKVLRVK